MSIISDTFNQTIEKNKIMLAPCALDTILSLRDIVDVCNDVEAYDALRILVRQLAAGYQSVVQAFWIFSRAVSTSPHREKYDTEIKKLYTVANVVMPLS